MITKDRCKMAKKNFFDLKQVQTTSGGVIKAFRKNFHITQTELAEITGIAETNISAIENNKIDIGVKRAVFIAAALGIDPSLILFPNGYEDSYGKDLKMIQQASVRLLSKKQAG